MNPSASHNPSTTFIPIEIGNVVMGERHSGPLLWSVLWTLLLGFATVRGAEKPVLELSVFRDASAGMSLEQVLALKPDAFEDSGPGFPVLGITHDAVWLRARMAPELVERTAFVAELEIARLSEVAWHVYAEGEDGLQPLAVRGLGLRYPAVTFELPQRKAIWILLKVRSDTSIHLPLHVMPLVDYPAFAKRRDALEFVGIGIGLAVMFATFVMGAYTRMRQFLFLGLHALSYLICQFAFDGYVSWIWPTAPHWMERNMLLVLSFVSPGVHLLLTGHYQRESGGASALAARMSWFGRGSLGIGLLCAVLPFSVAVWISITLVTVFVCIGTLGSTIHAWRLRTVSNVLMTLGWYLGLAAGAQFLLRFHALMDYPIPFEPVVLLKWFTPSVFLVSFGGVVVQVSRNQSERERRQRAEQATTFAQLQALRYQINPHFLYNTLNGIDALAHEAPERLSGLVRKVAAFLRTRLIPRPDHMTSLRNEMESVHAYLEIEKVRFGDRLRVLEDVEPNALSCEVPDLLLQSLVENAVKHSQTRDGVRVVKVAGGLMGDKLHLTVENSGSLTARRGHGMPNTGIGHANLRERLDLHYQGQGSFSIAESEGQVLTVIKIPKRLIE